MSFPWSPSNFKYSAQNYNQATENIQKNLSNHSTIRIQGSCYLWDYGFRKSRAESDRVKMQ